MKDYLKELRNALKNAESIKMGDSGLEGNNVIQISTELRDEIINRLNIIIDINNLK